MTIRGYSGDFIIIDDLLLGKMQYPSRHFNAVKNLFLGITNYIRNTESYDNIDVQFQSGLSNNTKTRVTMTFLVHDSVLDNIKR